LRIDAVHDFIGEGHVPHYVLDHMKKEGGPFYARLSGLYLVAGEPERLRLVNAFQREFEVFRTLANVEVPETD
jgi:hypothetical protein